MAKSGEPELRRAVKACTADRDTEMFLYSGPIYSSDVNKFIEYALQRTRRSNITLILTTYGGDAHAAYRLARALQSFFERIRLLVVGPCKSAGTLVTVCAHEVAFGPFGELGPLDIQVAKKDDLMAVSSGLDTFQALTILQKHAFATFEEYMLALLEGSQGAISTTTACEVASQLVTGLFQPLTAQLDPQRMGEMERMMTIAKAYGQRLGTENLKAGALDILIQDYPSHSFIIDYREAGRLFKNVKKITPDEISVLQGLQQRLGSDPCVFIPSTDILFADASGLLDEEPGQGGDHEAAAIAPDSPSNGSGEPGEARPEKSSKVNGTPARRSRREQSGMVSV